MPKYYKFMLGEDSKYAAECYEGEFIGTWYKIDNNLIDISNDEKAFKEKYKPIIMDGYCKYDKKTGQERNKDEKENCEIQVISQLWRFCNEMQIGDIIICPIGDNSNTYHVGKIESNYYYNNEYFENGERQPHRRNVEWLSKIKIDENEKTQELRGTLRANLTIIDLTKYTVIIEELIKPNKEKDNIFKSNIKTEKLKYYLDQFIIGLIVQYLKKILPDISKNEWWKTTIVDKLKPYQLKRIRKNNICDLNGFDIAELLFIIDNNWYEISQRCDFMYNDRIIVKEMVSVRNRISHLSNNGYNNLIDLLRDFDTTMRFLKLIDIGQEDIQKIIDEIEKIIFEIMRDILQDK